MPAFSLIPSYTQVTRARNNQPAIPSTRHDYVLYTSTKSKHSTHCSLHQKTSQQQISGIMVRLLAINPNKQISGPPSYSSKKFWVPPFSPPPPPPSNLNSDWSLGVDRRAVKCIGMYAVSNRDALVWTGYGFDQQRLIWYVCRLWGMVFSWRFER